MPNKKLKSLTAIEKLNIICDFEVWIVARHEELFTKFNVLRSTLHQIIKNKIMLQQYVERQGKEYKICLSEYLELEKWMKNCLLKIHTKKKNRLTWLIIYIDLWSLIIQVYSKLFFI